MRQLNIILAFSLIILFIFHALNGSLVLLGIIPETLKFLDYFGVAILTIHAIYSFYLTYKSIKTSSKSGIWYLKENLNFWIVRISGLLIFILMFFHFNEYGMFENGQFVVFPFTIDPLLIQLGLVLALFIHILTNIRPLIVSFGAVKLLKKRWLIYLIIVVILLFVIGSVMFYYVEWNPI